MVLITILSSIRISLFHFHFIFILIVIIIIVMFDLVGRYIGPTPSGPSSPSQMYLSPLPTPHQTPMQSAINSAPPHLHPLTLTPSSPQSMSPPLPNVVLSTPLPSLNGITSPVNSPLVSSNPTPQQGASQPPSQVQNSNNSTNNMTNNNSNNNPTQSGSTQSSHAPPLSRASSTDDTSRMLEEVRTLKQLYEMQVC